MNIFNSLGSNYDVKFVLEALFTVNKKGDSVLLKRYLENRYGGQATLVYKGREALLLALHTLKFPKNTRVGILGYTCHAVYRAVVDAGYIPAFIDCGQNDINFSAHSVAEILKNNSAMRVLIIQNTLGFPCNIQEIQNYCRMHSIVLIEDLAHSVGARYLDGQEAGTVGDMTVLSFSQDKMIDAISGGALVVRNKKYKLESTLRLASVSLFQQCIDRVYPFFTLNIRIAYPFILGKAFHALLKRFSLLSKPMGSFSTITPHDLPCWYCRLAYESFQDLGKNIAHRQSIATLYAKKLNPTILSNTLTGKISYSPNLRFPVFVKNRDTLILYLKTHGIYVSDIWYDAPIAPKSYSLETSYSHECPESERISSCMINLPTHRNVTVHQAEEIVRQINLWLK